MTEYWVSHGKHYCEYCNANIQSHKRAVEAHNQSAFHKANVQKFLETKKKLREDDDKKKSEVMAEIARVSMAAAAAEVGMPSPNGRSASPPRAPATAPTPVDADFEARQAKGLAMFYAVNSDVIDAMHAQHRAQADEKKRKEQEELDRVRKMLEDKRREKERAHRGEVEEEAEEAGEKKTDGSKKRAADSTDDYSAPMPGRWQVVKPQAAAEPAYETKIIVVPRAPAAAEEEDDDEDDEDDFVKKEEMKEEEDVPAEVVVFAKRRAGAARQVRRERIGHE